jgi:hypothetical protein
VTDSLYGGMSAILFALTSSKGFDTVRYVHLLKKLLISEQEYRNRNHRHAARRG